MLTTIHQNTMEQVKNMLKIRTTLDKETSCVIKEMSHTIFTPPICHKWAKSGNNFHPFKEVSPNIIEIPPTLGHNVHQENLPT